MLYLRLLVNNRRLIAKFGGSQKFYMDFRLWRGTGTPNPCVAQGSTVRPLPFPWCFPHPTVTLNCCWLQAPGKPSSFGSRSLWSHTADIPVAGSLIFLVCLLSILAVAFNLSPCDWRMRHHCLTQLCPAQEGGVCRYVFILGEMSLLRSLVCVSFVCFDLIWVQRKIFPRSSPSPPQQAYPPIVLARNQSHTHPKPITARGEMDRHDWLETCLLPEAGGEAHCSWVD